MTHPSRVLNLDMKAKLCMPKSYIYISIYIYIYILSADCIYYSGIRAILLSQELCCRLLWKFIGVKSVWVDLEDT